MLILLLVFPPQADFRRQTVNPFALGSFCINGKIVPARRAEEHRHDVARRSHQGIAFLGRASRLLSAQRLLNAAELAKICLCGLAR